MKNRLMLAPLTNCQSHSDGRLSNDDFNWLTMRMRGGFGLIMTCAAFVQSNGRGFAGQLGVCSDEHSPGLARLAKDIRAAGGSSSVQLYHGGCRSPGALVGQAVSSSDDPATGARAMTPDEIEDVIENFIASAQRVERAGFDGAELHGAHGYLLTQFLSPGLNRRKDAFGGSLANRSRIVHRIIDGIRSRCRPDFQLGLRLSTEHFGLRLGEMIELTQELMDGGKLDYIDFSLWDIFKEPEENSFKGRSLLSRFTRLRRGDVRIGCAGKILSGHAVNHALSEGADFVLLGRAAILHHDFPARMQANPAFSSRPLPAPGSYLRSEGVSPPFLTYLETMPGMLAPEEAVPS